MQIKDHLYIPVQIVVYTSRIVDSTYVPTNDNPIRVKQAVLRCYAFIVSLSFYWYCTCRQ